MPRGDGTGPAGMGPMTGKASGYCAGYSVPGFANPPGGRFIGSGRNFFSGMGSRGRGYRNWYNYTGLPGWQRSYMGMPAWGGLYAPPVFPNPGMFEPERITPDQEKEMLMQQAEFLKQQIEDIQSRMSELEKDSAKKDK